MPRQAFRREAVAAMTRYLDGPSADANDVFREILVLAQRFTRHPLGFLAEYREEGRFTVLCVSNTSSVHAPLAEMHLDHSSHALFERLSAADVAVTGTKLWAPLPPGHPPVGGWVALPLRAHGRLVGCLVLADGGAEIPFSERRARCMHALLSTLRVLVETDSARRTAQQSIQHTEAIIEERTHELRAAVEASNTALHREREFMALCTHELRTPVHAITLAAEMLESDPSMLTEVRLGAATLRAVVDDVLEDARAGRDADRDEARSMVSVASLIDQAVRPSMLAMKQAKLTFTLDVGDLGVTHVLAKSTPLVQSIANLLSNATKYSASSIRCVFESTAHEFLVTVLDDGVLEQVDLESLFRPYTRAHKAHHRGGGVGLGLVNTQRMMATIGGRLCAFVHPTRFVLSLPIASSSSSSPSPSMLVQSSSPSQTLRSIHGRSQTMRLSRSFGSSAAPLSVDDDLGALCFEPDQDPPPRVGEQSVLIAEDNPLLAKLVVRMMKTMGYQKISLAQTGEAAMTQVQAGPFDVAVLDMYMPVFTGLEVARALRERARTAGERMAVVVIASADHSLAPSDTDLDFKYLPKPFSRAELERVISA